MIDLLILLLKPALRCTDGGSREPHHIAAALAAWLLDMLICHTTWAAMYGWPQRGEWTISHTLERLCDPANHQHEDFALLWQLALKINRVAGGPHIKIVA